MRNFLSDYISGLSSGLRQRATEILESAKVEKSQLDTIVDRLNASGLFPNLVVPSEPAGGLVSADRFGLAFRDAMVTIESMYRESNDISLLLDSHAAILTADVSALQKELDALEKAMANYAFLLSDAKAYDYAYLESFNDARGQDIPDWLIPDRSQLVFSDNEFATVDTQEGALTLPMGQGINYPLTGSSASSNYAGYVTSDTGLSNATSLNSSTGWRIAISTPAPVNATLLDFDFYGEDTFSGALTAVDFTLSQPSPCDSIRVEAFADSPFEVVQIKVYPDLSSEDGSLVLNQSETVTGVHNFFFPLQSVAKFRLYLQQSTYKRSGANPVGSEVLYSKLHNEVYSVKSFADEALKSHIQRTMLLLSATNVASQLKNMYDVSIPRTSFETQFGATTLEDILVRLRQDRSTSASWGNDSVAGRVISKMIKNYMFKDNYFLYNYEPHKEESGFFDPISQSLSNFVDFGSAAPPTAIMASDSSQAIADIPPDAGYRYDYNLGFKYISIGTSLAGFKGVFVSTKLPAPGDIGELRLKSDDVDYALQNAGRDSALVTSIEYSVTNKSVASKEDDWIPIVPVNTEVIQGERFFPNTTGRGILRFPANTAATIKLYKNGYLTNYDQQGFFIYAQDLQSIEGLIVPLGEFTQQDIFTVDYAPASDFTVVRFQNDDVPLVSANDINGAGEGFNGTSGQLSVALNYTPYIDYENGVANSTFDTTNGLHPYQPVTVVLEDGTVAINKTDYKGGSDSSISSADSGYTFIHSGDVLIFNKPISQDFRVYYQYMPSNVRVRIVLRSNDVNFVSPKVNAFQVKAKTRKADAKRYI